MKTCVLMQPPLLFALCHLTPKDIETLDLATPAFLTPPPTVGGSSSTSQEWIKKGALVNVLENTSPGYNIEPGLGKIWKIHYVSGGSDVVKCVDIKYILDNRMLKNVNVTG